MHCFKIPVRDNTSDSQASKTSEKAQTQSDSSNDRQQAGLSNILKYKKKLGISSHKRAYRKPHSVLSGDLQPI
jgi:hypothetical protein